MGTSNKSVDSLLADIASKGWHVSSMNQTQEGMWMASVRKPGNFPSGFGQSTSGAAAALEKAWENRKEPMEDRMPVIPATLPPVVKSSTRVRLKRKL